MYFKHGISIVQKIFNNNIIDFENIYVNYGQSTVLENINLRINKGENWVILGANGSGKSTLIKLFSHDLYPNTQYNFKKEIFGRDRWDIFELKKYLGIITNDLQNRFAVYGGQSSGLSVMLSGYYSSLGTFQHHNFSKEQIDNALKVMDFLKITGLKDKKFSHMSTGEQRLCLIGRALVHEPEAFVLDEPTTGLDIRARNCFLKTLRNLSQKSSLILVTHNVEEIFPEITHVALIHNKTIYKQGKKEDILTSKNLSEIFRTKIELSIENNRYNIKDIASLNDDYYN